MQSPCGMHTFHSKLNEMTKQKSYIDFQGVKERLQSKMILAAKKVYVLMCYDF